MNEKEIEYLAQRVNRGDYYNRMVKQKVMYLDTNELNPKSKERFSKKELSDFQKKEDDVLGKRLVEEYQRRQRRSRDYDYGYDDIMNGGQKGGNVFTDLLYGRDDNNRRDVYRKDMYRRSMRSYPRKKFQSKNKKNC